MASEGDKEKVRKNFALRISPDLYVALERWAADELRSVNSQIEFLLAANVLHKQYMPALQLPSLPYH